MGQWRNGQCDVDGRSSEGTTRNGRSEGWIGTGSISGSGNRTRSKWITVQRLSKVTRSFEQSHRRMHCRLSHEWRAIADAQRISDSACRSRLFRNVLDKMPYVDSRSFDIRREFLDEDRLSHSRHAAGHNDARRNENGKGQDATNRPLSSSILYRVARWRFQAHSGSYDPADRHRVQWIWSHRARGDIRRQLQDLDCDKTRRGLRSLLLPGMEFFLDTQISGTLLVSGSSHRRYEQNSVRRTSLESRRLSLESDRAAGIRRW